MDAGLFFAVREDGKNGRKSGRDADLFFAVKEDGKNQVTRNSACEKLVGT